MTALVRPILSLSRSLRLPIFLTASLLIAAINVPFSGYASAAACYQSHLPSPTIGNETLAHDSLMNVLTKFESHRSETGEIREAARAQAYLEVYRIFHRLSYKPLSFAKDHKELMKNIGLNRIGISDGALGTATGPRGDLNGLVFYEHQEGMVAPIRASIKSESQGSWDPSTTYINNISIILKPQELREHLPQLILKARSWAAKSMTVDMNYVTSFKFLSKQDAMNFAKELEKYIIHHKLNPVEQVLAKQIGSQKVYFRSAKLSFIAMKLMSYPRRLKAFPEACPNFRACFEMIKEEILFESKLDVSTGLRDHPLKELPPLEKSLLSYELPPKLIHEQQRMSHLPMASRRNYLLAVKLAWGQKGLHERFTPQRLSDEMMNKMNPGIKKIVSDVQELLNSPDQFAFFVSDVLGETLRVMEKNPKYAHHLQNGTIPREAVYEVFNRWNHDFGYEKFGVIGKEVLTDAQFAEVLKNGPFIDHAFEYGSIAHGIDAHALQLMYVGRMLGPHRDQDLKTLMTYLAEENMEAWAFLFDTPLSGAWRFNSPEVVSEFFGQFTELH